MAVVTQPHQVEMDVQGQPQLPESLKYFAGLDEIMVKQIIEAMEALTGFETRNRYAIMNKEKQQIFFAQEHSSSFERCINPGGRGFQIHVTDNENRNIMRFRRDFKWCQGCCWCGEGCCNMNVYVEHPFGKVIGKVSIGNGKCHHNIKVYDVADNHVFTVWTSCCPCQDVCCPDDINIPITDPTMTTRVGNIAKVWKGCCVEALTDADLLRLTFPANLSIDHKALMLGALFTVDFLMFEKN